MKAFIIVIGDEILLGQVQDTNSRFIARELARLGIEVVETRAIPDTGAGITAALDDALARTGIVVMTGGLGPTRDDVTKLALSDYFHSPLEMHAGTLARIEKMMEKTGRPLDEYARGQALVPAGCRALDNDKGTAPGMWFEREGKIVISLPGVPFEMECIFEKEVVPRLRRAFPEAMLDYRVLVVHDLPESRLAARLATWEDALPGELSLAYLPAPGLVRLRLTARGGGIARLEEHFASLRAALADTRYLVGDEASMESELATRARREGKTIAVAESCTGGEIARRLTAMPGASTYFKGGVVAYSNEVKMAVLGVDKETLARRGAVSEEVACQMAEGARRVLGADVAVATTGVAGPGGGSAGKPVGTVWIAVSTPGRTRARLFRFSTVRERNVARAASKAIEMTLDAVNREA
jgi:nicotinamide-nucleotide amidase